MKLLSRNFIFFIFFFFSLAANAQKVFIANDFGNCGVGLRDSSGKWLAEPIYTSIEVLTHGYFKALLGSKEGVLDSMGNVVVPPVYDYLNDEEVYRDSVSDYIFFSVINDGKAGLLNSKNETIIPLQYKYIEVAYDGTIIAKRSKTHYSLFDIYGKETIIPGRQPAAPDPMGGGLISVAKNSCWPAFGEKYHQNHKYSWRGFYYPVLTLSKRYGVMNDSLRLLIPKKFHSVAYKPGDYRLVEVATRKKTGYYTKEGKEIWAPVYDISYSFLRSYTTGYGTVSTINHYGFTAVQYKKKWGIIGANGDTILPFRYSYINAPFSYNTSAKKAGIWVVEDGNKQGAFDPGKREWLLRPEYSMLYSIRSYRLPGDTAEQNSGYRLSNYYSSIYDQNGMKIFIAAKNGKFGMITSDGQELLPFDYDYYTYNYSGYTFINNSTFTFVSFPDGARNEKYFYSRPPVVNTAPADGKLKKVIYKNGDVLWINPDLLTDSAQLSLYTTRAGDFVFNPQTYDHQLHATALVITTLHPSQKFGRIPHAYSVHNSDLVYSSEADSTIDFILDPADNYNSRNISIAGSDSSHVYYNLGNAGGIIRDDGVQLLRAGGYEYFNYYSTVNGKAVFRITSRQDKTGLMDGDGKLLIDTVWRYIGPSNSGNYFWVRKKDSRFFRYNSYSWNILDTTTGQLQLTKKQSSGEANPFGTDAVVMDYSNHGPKLYNYRTKKFVLSSNANEIYKLDSIGKYFAVRTCFGHIGIIDGNGNWLADTIWTALIDANNLQAKKRWFGYRYNYDEYPGGNAPWCVLSNDTGWIIYDGTKGTVSKAPATKKFLLDLSRNSVHFDSTGQVSKNCSDCPSWIYRDSTDEKPLAGWQQKMLFDSLFMGEHFSADSNYFWHVYPCADCLKKNKHQYFEYAWAKNYDRESLLHYADFNNDSCFSVSRCNLSSYMYAKRYPKDLFFTAVLYPDGPHPFELDSLFEGTAWKKMISDEVTLYFESNPGIKGNCHNPNMLPLVLKDRFILTKNGIELFPPGFSENEAQLFVPVSWKKLKPYMRKDVIRKLQI
jgi:hypothetical protein